MRLRLPDRAPFDYQTIRNNGVWPDHRLRTRITAEMIAWLEPDSVIDPACGDGSIVLTADTIRPIKHIYLSDVSLPSIEALYLREGLSRRFTITSGAVADVLANPFSPEPADLVVLTEFLEHVEDPVAILKLARAKGRNLIASSPLFECACPERNAGHGYRSDCPMHGQSPVDDNPEHLWQFDAESYHDMLVEAGWEAVAYVPLYFESIYDFQLWGAR